MPVARGRPPHERGVGAGLVVIVRRNPSAGALAMLAERLAYVQDPGVRRAPPTRHDW